MEGCVYLYINFLIGQRKKFMKLEEFCIRIFSYNDNKIDELENTFHIKYLKLQDIKSNEFTLLYFTDTYRILLDSTEFCKLWISTIDKTKKKYLNFLEEYYMNPPHDRFSLDFDSIVNITEILGKSLKSLQLGEELENLLDKNTAIINSLTEYINEIDKFYFKLDASIPNQNIVKNKAKELKSLINELHVTLSNTTRNLNSNEIKLYLIEFSSILTNKISETQSLIDEVKYLFRNYVSLRVDYLEQRNVVETDVREEIINSPEIKENDLLNLKLKNSQIELLIEEKQKQIDMINMYLNEI